MKPASGATPHSIEPAQEKVLSPIRFRLFGAPEITLNGGEENPLAPTRYMQLLVYLTVRGSWQRRDDIAHMFWPESSSKIAHSNLRNLLCKAVAAAPYAPIESTEHALRLKVPSDLGDFASALQLQDWQTAAQIGAEELLLGFEGTATDPYLLWLRAEREARLEEWKQAVQGLLSQSSSPLEYRDALAQSWALRCPYDEDAVQARVTLAHERDQAATAAKIYRAFEARLRSELDVRPSRELEHLALSPQRLAAPNPVQFAARSVSAPRVLNPAHSPIVGRRLELRQLTSLLKNDSPQLITITGPGGVGKSTLLAAFHQQWVDGGGVDAFLIDVSAATSANAVMVTIASALGITVSQDTPEQAALADALGERNWLLMIDGAEQAGIAAPLALLLERCPQTRLLVASRQRLHVGNERLLAMDGFPLPDVDEADADLLDANDGVRFLADAIAKAGQPVTMARDAMTLAAIVRAVEGLPLALNLLGKLTHLYSLNQLLDSVQQRAADTLWADTPGLTELLPSLLASFQRSWMSLSPTEQEVLARLTVFPESFEIAAGRWVAKTELPVITSLVDRSLLRTDGAGRLSLHAAIRSCVQAIYLQPLIDAETDYVTFYTERLHALASLAKTKTVRPLHRYLHAERTHVDRAWFLALKRRDYAKLLRQQESLWFLDYGAGDAMDFSARCIEAERVIRDDPAAPTTLRAMLLAGMALNAFQKRCPEMALEHARNALRAAQCTKHYDASVSAVKTLIYVYASQHNFKQAELLMPRQDKLLGRVDEGVFALHIPMSRGVIAFARGNLEDCIKHVERSVNLARQIEDSDAELRSLVNMVFSFYKLNMPDSAIAFEQRALAVGATGETNPDLLVAALSAFTHLQINYGDVAQARIYAERAGALSYRHPQMQMLRLQVKLAQAAVLTAQGHLTAASKQLGEILDILSINDVPAVAATAFVVTAKWFRSSGNREACVNALRSIRPKSASSLDFLVATAILRELGEAPVDPNPSGDHSAQIRMAANVARQRMNQMVPHLQS